MNLRSAQGGQLQLYLSPVSFGTLTTVIARRRSGDTGAIQNLTARLKARIENSKKQQLTDRYRLQDDALSKLSCAAT